MLRPEREFVLSVCRDVWIECLSHKCTSNPLRFAQLGDAAVTMAQNVYSLVATLVW